MNRVSKILIKIIVLVVFTLSFSSTAYALGEYTTLAPLPGTTQQGTPGQTNLETYIPGVFRLSIAIAAIMAFVMITFGGIMYATSDAISNKSQGKEYVTNAIYGLLLVLGAWVILYTINPKILNFTLSIDQIVSNNSTTTPAVSSGTCTNCIKITGLPISGSSNDSISSLTLPKLNALNDLLKAAGISWVITEAYPPTVNHQCACHRTGTCVDARPVDRNRPSHINMFYQAARTAGLNPEYEVATDEDRKVLIANGVTIPIKVVPGINGAHFSVYNPSCSS